MQPSNTDSKRPNRVNLNYHSLIGVSPGMIKNSENRVSSNNFNGKSIRSLTSAINGIDRATSSSLERYQMLNRKSPIRKKVSKESSFFKKNSQRAVFMRFFARLMRCTRFKFFRFFLAFLSFSAALSCSVASLMASRALLPAESLPVPVTCGF